jgi:hypothetical protein
MARTRLRRSGELVIVVINGVGFADGQCLPQARFVERTNRFALLRIRSRILRRASRVRQRSVARAGREVTGKFKRISSSG